MSVYTGFFLFCFGAWNTFECTHVHALQLFSSRFSYPKLHALFVVNTSLIVTFSWKCLHNPSKNRPQIYSLKTWHHLHNTNILLQASHHRFITTTLTWSIPGFHGKGSPVVVCFLLLSHVLVILPGLWHHGHYSLSNRHRQYTDLCKWPVASQSKIWNKNDCLHSKIRSKHKKDLKECLFIMTWTTRCKFTVKSASSGHKTTLKQQWNS